jgi:hypothetical protein
MAKTMTMRERILAVIRGDRPDRVPFVQYENAAAPDAEIWERIGRGNMGLLRWTRLHRIEHPNCTTRTEAISLDELSGQRTIIQTPGGTLTAERLFEPTYGTGAAHHHFIRQPQDYDALLAYLKDAVVVADSAPFERAVAELGDDGLPLPAVERTPFQQLWVQWVSIEDLSYHMLDCPERVAACMDALAQQEREVCRVAAAAPVEFVDFPDNITAPVIGPDNFQRYCVPFYNELAELLGERPVFVHMDGDLQPLWPAIGASGVRGIDSLSPPPDNDTSAGQAVSMWPDTRVWVNYPSSVHLAAPRVVYDQTAEILEQAGHSGRLQIQISENVPPGLWRQSFPEIVRAIEDFGRP